jgi:putative hydrolase of the HAD superfamily
MIRGVFFDAGNTILFPDYKIYKSIATSLGLDVETDVVRRAEALARSAFDRAVAESPGSEVHGFWPVYYTPFFEHLGLPPSVIPEAIEKTRVANGTGLGIWSVPVEGFSDTMAELRERDLALGIISNSDGRLESRLDSIGIRGHFDFVIDSAVVGVSKPDPRIFQLALEASSLPPDETVYVGDYYVVDVLGARGAGMRPVLFDPCEAYGEVDCDVMERFEDIVDLLDVWSTGVTSS